LPKMTDLGDQVTVAESRSLILSQMRAPKFSCFLMPDRLLARSVWSIWSIWSIWSVSCVWLNETNQMNQTDQMDRIDQMNKTAWRTFLASC